MIRGSSDPAHLSNDVRTYSPLQTGMSVRTGWGHFALKFESAQSQYIRFLGISISSTACRLEGHDVYHVQTYIQGNTSSTTSKVEQFEGRQFFWREGIEML